MDFVNRFYLWLLPLGALPIVIYYLMRFRSLRVTWGANYILERALARWRRKLYSEQLLLIALRVVICLLVVIAFARPCSRRKSATITGSGIHHVLLVDGSYSMLAADKDQSRWDRAREAMKQLVRTWGRGEVWSLCLLGEQATWVVDAQTITSPEQGAAAIDGLTTGECAISLAKAWAELAAKFPQGGLELYLFADDQALSWRGLEPLRLPGTTIYWVNPPLARHDNVAVTAVRTSVERALVRHPVRVFVSAHNYGATPVTDVEAKILVDGVVAGAETISLLPGQEGWLHADVSFDEPGSHYVTARFRDDVLNFDNTLSAALEVVPKLRVLVLKDAEAKGKFNSAWPFLEIAARTQQMRDEDEAPVFTLGPLELLPYQAPEPPKDKDLAAVDVVLLDGGRTLTPDLATVLRDFVRSGGGLILAADELVDRQAWHELLIPAGLLPAKLGQQRVQPLGGEHFQGLARGNFATGPFRPFETGEDGDVEHARFYTWYELTDVVPGAVALAQFSDRQPYAVQRRADLGTTILLAAGLNGRSNNLVVREFCYPFLFRLVAAAAAGGIHPRTVACNQPLSYRLPPGAAVRGATLSLPGREPLMLTPRAEGSHQLVTAPAGSSRSGLASLLVLQDAGATKVWYGIQGERPDSDLTPLAPDQHQRLVSELGIVETSDWASLNEALARTRSGREWHHWAMAGLLTALLGAMLLELRFI